MAELPKDEKPLVLQGGPEATAETIAGNVTFWFPPLALAIKNVHEGNVIALGVTGSKRAASLPDVPTVAETGAAGFEDTGWVGVWAPGGIPVNVADKIAKDIARALAAPDLREQLKKLGAEPMSMILAEFAKFVRGEMESAARIIKAAGIKQQ
jgi:tripartite-type tricarboxylate transporter receptor subunit TctC